MVGQRETFLRRPFSYRTKIWIQKKKKKKKKTTGRNKDMNNRSRNHRALGSSLSLSLSILCNDIYRVTIRNIVQLHSILIIVQQLLCEEHLLWDKKSLSASQKSKKDETIAVPIPKSNKNVRKYTKTSTEWKQSYHHRNAFRHVSRPLNEMSI